MELRSFEMPPHAEMSLAQHLLLRAAIARFWQKPFEAKLVRWGTELHDRFLLPHFIWDDFKDVIADFQGFGYDLKPEWFAPHVEFRCPTIGTFTQRNVHVELRTALEPWNVLGEEPAGGGNVRFVDSSLERLQVKVSGLIDSRHLISCNGRQVPLHPTGTVGEYVAGVKYRAWQAAELPASHDSISRATNVRSAGHVESTQPWRMHLSCGASGWIELRVVSSKCL